MSKLAATCRNAMRSWALVPALVFAALVGSVPAAAQIDTVDPSQAIDGDLSGAQSTGTQPPSGDVRPALDLPPGVQPVGSSAPVQETTVLTDPGIVPADAAASGDTYKQDDLIGAAEGVFGKGAEGLARMIEDILKKQGEPNAYIVGREGGGAFIVGARYGSGTLYHKVEGQMPVYWRGPSLGVDVGANAAKTFVLVYNLFDSADLFKAYGAGEGQAYLIGGFHVSYLRKGDVVLIPVRMGAGLRLGVNVGYMKFSKKQKWLPF